MTSQLTKLTNHGCQSWLPPQGVAPVTRDLDGRPGERLSHTSGDERRVVARSISWLRSVCYARSLSVPDQRGCDRKKAALPPRAWTWIVGVHVLAVAWASAAAIAEQHPRWELLRFVLLVACAVLHVHLTRESEERRRQASNTAGSSHIDQSSVWTFTAALVLPVPLALALLIVLRAQIFLIARKPAIRFIFSSSAIAISVLGAHALSAATPLHDFLTGLRPWPTGQAEIVGLVVALAAAAAMYFVIQAALIGVVIGLTTGKWALPAVFGDREVNLFAIGTLLGAMCAAAAQSVSPWLLLIVVPLVVNSTRDKQRLQRAAAAEADLRHDALHNRLTGLPVRAGFDPLAQLALVTDQQQDRITALLLIDVDRFKAWNDEFGYWGGDRVLVGVAEVLRETTRHGDLLCRRNGDGGDEMMVLLPNTTPREALHVAERIRDEVSRRPIEVSRPAGGTSVVLGRDVAGCTVSIGVSVSPQHGTTLEELEFRAGHALLRQAKRQGRNRVVTFSGEGDPTTAQEEEQHVLEARAK
ncbi:GGDEF domain-containing protein [Saccharopolyspora shandongensis]|uniref:GGDEF domain-containing protein n=1 Tax=Saccharopolyspora shandongensis TaxID=418495 RepID=UPI0033F93E7C